MKACTITIHPDTMDLTIRSPYDAGFVTDIKCEIPSFARRWEPDIKRWIVQEVYGADAVLVCEKYYQVSYVGEVHLIDRLEAQAKLLRIARNVRGAQDQAARDQSQPEYVPAIAIESEKLTYFGILGVSVDADENAIRQAYKNSARLAHPDGGGSHEQFLAVQKAYDTLRDPNLRKKYLFGLKLISGAEGQESQEYDAPKIPNPAKAARLAMNINMILDRSRTRR